MSAMGIRSATNSITRYRVSGKLAAPIHETVFQTLQANSMPAVEDDVSEMVVGWTSVAKPFTPDFEGLSFVFGTYMIFSLRIDKKNLPSKVIQKHCAQTAARRLAETGRSFLSRDEERAIKDHVIHKLIRRVPATPNIYDLIWNHETRELWFFSNLKAANEALETLFFQSFELHLLRLFPYTMAELLAKLNPSERDQLKNLEPTDFIG